MLGAKQTPQMETEAPYLVAQWHQDLWSTWLHLVEVDLSVNRKHTMNTNYFQNDQEIQS